MATLNIKNFPEALYRRLRKRADEQRRSVAQEVTRIIERELERGERVSILELKGLGKEVWEGLDAAEHVASERDAWG